MDLPKFKYILLERQGNIFVITLQRPPENRLNSEFCQEIIKAFHTIQRILGPNSEGAVITRGHDAKYWCTGLELEEEDANPFVNSDGFFPMIHTILDFPFPTVALLTGHTFGGASVMALAHDYRVMNASRGFICLPPINLGLHFHGIGTLARLKLGPKIARKMVLEAHKWTGKEALVDGLVDAVALSEDMFGVALEIARKWAPKAKMG
ncbi:hypothetical protein VF21_09647 [Pseudogymnoascus sp. 05NY08]|nr:hypothetical protein VF21_09647 [Pseudogymnoascus sp. 05NY08]